MVTRCPEPAQLLRDFLADGRAPAEVASGRHEAQCESCRATLAQIRQIVDTVRRSTLEEDEWTPECLAEDWITAFVEGSIDPAHSSAEFNHLLDCARCCHAAASVARLLDDTAVAAEMQRLESPPRAARTRLTKLGAITGLAAAVALVVLVGRSDSPHLSEPGGPEPTFREPSITTVAPPALLSPAGVVSAADRLSWSSVARSDRYRVTVFDRDGSVVWESETADTVLALPRRARTIGSTYLWRVEARVGWEDRWVASELAEFTVRPSPVR